MTSTAATGTQAALSARTHEILATIDDPDLQAKVSQTAQLAVGALADLGRLHLPQDHFEAGADDRHQDDMHLELAPYVLAALRGINGLLGHLVASFPPPPAPADASSAQNFDLDFDLEFDLVDGPEGDGGLSATPKSGTATPAEQVADAVYAYGSMLRSRVLAFAERLRHALAQSDSWPLLAELDDNQHRLAKAVQGVLFGVLAIFAAGVRREDILPEYRSAVSEAVALRSALADLTFHINRFNGALAEATADTAVPLLVGVADRLARFAGRPEYRSMRAEDKKLVIDFRHDLHAIRHAERGVPMQRLRQKVEGFSKFLESMQAINHREVLVLHDHQRLEAGLASIDALEPLCSADPAAAREAIEQLVASLGSVYGRNPDLDARLRTYYQRSEAGLEPLTEQPAAWRAIIQATLMTVG